VECEWDPLKAATNLRKHGVRFADAAMALEDDSALTISEMHPGNEQRWVTLGMDDRARLLVVVYTWRGNRPRLVSARAATRAERNQYEEHK
jgi:uncharacterized protein